MVQKIELEKATSEEEAVEMALKSGLLKNPNTIVNGRKMYDINTAHVKSRDNYNKPTAYMMGEPEGDGKAFELSDKIWRFRKVIFKAVGEVHIHEMGLMTDSIFGSKEFVKGQVGENAELKEYVLKNDTVTIRYYGAKIDYAPETSDAIQKGWEYHNFHHTVLVADVTLLNKLISEAQTAELNSITQLMSAIHASDFTFDEIGAKVFA